MKANPYTAIALGVLLSTSNISLVQANEQQDTYVGELEYREPDP